MANIRRLPGPLSKDHETLLAALARLTLDDTHKIDPDSIWWIAVDRHNDPVGFAGLQPSNHDFAFLCLCGVLSQARGQGLQKRFIRTRVKAARAMGYDRAVSYTAPDNLVSANNLIKNGFKLYEPPAEYGVDHALYFQKYLTGT